ncbi:hypothetical protein HX882_32155 [Pseudomonas gingeri]|uniref:Uncharacterized protein n=1 Tax=Pseudomonas gingeri TaxID=117681 RepID=A0A7Y8C650_9PSED|nr:hypothetical protein [Pseudomonas gingeri]NWC00535.1 hypothetical protein [Pseudomonas gingeri]
MNNHTHHGPNAEIIGQTMRFDLEQICKPHGLGLKTRGHKLAFLAFDPLGGGIRTPPPVTNLGRMCRMTSNGRVLAFWPGTHTNVVENRTLNRSQRCANPCGPSLAPPCCSEGGFTRVVPDIQRLNGLIDAEPGSTLQVTP